MGTVYKAKAAFKGSMAGVRKQMADRIKITVTPHKDKTDEKVRNILQQR